MTETRQQIYEYPQNAYAGDMLFVKIPKLKGLLISPPPGWTFQGDHYEDISRSWYSVYYKMHTAKEGSCAVFTLTETEEV